MAFTTKTNRAAPLVLPDSDPVPTVGRVGGHAGHVQRPSDRQRHTFIALCGLQRGIVVPSTTFVIPSAAEESETVIPHQRSMLLPKPRSNRQPAHPNFTSAGASRNRHERLR